MPDTETVDSFFTEPTETALAERPENQIVLPGADSGMMQMAEFLSKSDVIPAQYRGKIANCFIAVEFAQRTGFPAMTVMQNMVPIMGKPTWSSQFLIAMINACGKFDPLEFQYFGERGTDEYGCRAITKRIGSDRELVGTDITIAMARAEGWLDKKGSKWLTMGQQMLAYRAAAFFARLYVPELMAGMRTENEEQEMVNVTPKREKSSAELAWEDQNVSETT